MKWVKHKRERDRWAVWFFFKCYKFFYLKHIFIT
jgi:hypothetical protein